MTAAPPPLASEPIRVIIFEDNANLRAGLYQLINGSPGFQCVGSYPDCSKILTVLANAPADVVIMDIGLPGMDGIEGVRILRENYPKTRILMLTVFEDQDKIFDSICAGASGYLLKSTPASKILEAILEVKAGGAPMSPLIASKVLTLVKSPIAREPDTQFNLTAREKEVLTCLVKGMSYKMIAAELFISADTVRSHLRVVYDKLHVHSKTEAVIKAINRNIV